MGLDRGQTIARPVVNKKGHKKGLDSMNIRNLLQQPQNAVQSASRLLVTVLAILMAASLLHQVVSRIELSLFDALGGLLLLSAVSAVAYVIRERRKPRKMRSRPHRGAERTPLLPPGEED